MGCDGFVTKPCLPDDLVAEVRATLEAAGRLKAAPRGRHRTEPPSTCYKLAPMNPITGLLAALAALTAVFVGGWARAS